jgi:hypothetical protein
MPSSLSVFIAALALASLLPAQAVRTQSLCLPTVGTMSRLHRTQGIALADGFAVMADDSAGLVIVDISSPGDPVQVASVLLPHAEHVVVEDGLAYVTDRESLHIIDVSRPAVPTLLGRFPTRGRSYALAVDDGIAYLSAGYGAPWNGLKIVDASDASLPREIGAYAFSDFCQSLAVRDGHLFAARSSTGLTVLDVAEPSRPVDVGLYEAWGGAQSVAIYDDLAFVTTGGSFVATTGALQLIDVSDPTLLVKVGSYQPPGGDAERVTVSGDIAVVTVFDTITLTYKTQIVDVSAPERPEMIHDCDIACFGAFPMKTVLSDNLAFAAAWRDGLRIVDLSYPSAPERIGSLDPSPIRALTCHRGFAYSFGHFSDLLEIFAVPASGDPYLMSAYRAPGDITAFEISGERAFLAVGDLAVVVLDAAAPVGLTEIGTVVPSAPFDQIMVSGSTLYVISDDTIEILDVTDPADAQPRGRFEFDFFHEGEVGPIVEVDNHLLVGVNEWAAATRNELWILDVSDPENPTAVSVTELPWHRVRDIDVVGDFAFVTIDYHGVLAFDIAHPEAPIPIGEYVRPLHAGSFQQMVIHDDLALITASGGTGSEPALILLDLADPAHPVVKGGHFQGMDANSLSLPDGRACVLLDDSQMAVLDADGAFNCESPRRTAGRRFPVDPDGMRSPVLEQRH